jgi:pyrimidine-nucleoside phosphorylase
MIPVEIIKLKRDKKTLTREHIEFFINGYLSGEITDYQMSAFLMAVYFNGMTEEETFDLTEIMLNSGKVADLSFIDKIKVDKHSTGGVGDKTSLILAPLVASCGIAVPMISGRALGHTGGTLDKLESIPGFNVNYSVEDYKRIIGKIGVVMIGQNSDFAPADKRIYSLRDVTGTVDNLSLITASIMSKKLAEGADAIVFDIKIGNGANLQNTEESKKLTKYLISVSKKFGKKAIAVLTDMNEPLGYKIGNWLEVEECLEVMNGKIVEDLNKVNNVLSGAMIYLGGKAGSIEEGEKIAKQKLQDGSAYKKFLGIAEEQKGNTGYIKDWNNYKRAKYSKKIISEKTGYVGEMNAHKFGLASIELGCGRKKVVDKIDYLAGIILNKKCGDEIKQGEVVCELWAEDKGKIEKAEIFINDGIKISDSKPKERNLIIDIIIG